MSVHAKQLPALQVHDVVAIQDPTGHPRRWSKTGKIIEALDHDSYMVTKRNGQFLRKLGLYRADTDIFDPMPPLTTPPVPVIDAHDQLEDEHDGDTPD